MGWGRLYFADGIAGKSAYNGDMQLPTPLHDFLWQAAFSPWEEWYSSSRLILADYVQEQMGDDARGEKIRQEKPDAKEAVRLVQEHTNLMAQHVMLWGRAECDPDKVAENIVETTRRNCRRRVLSLFPEVEFEVPGGYLVADETMRLEKIMVKAPDLIRPQPETGASPRAQYLRCLSDARVDRQIQQRITSSIKKMSR